MGPDLLVIRLAHPHFLATVVICALAVVELLCFIDAVLLPFRHTLIRGSEHRLVLGQPLLAWGPHAADSIQGWLKFQTPECTPTSRSRSAGNG